MQCRCFIKVKYGDNCLTSDRIFLHRSLHLLTHLRQPERSWGPRLPQQVHVQKNSNYLQVMLVSTSNFIRKIFGETVLNCLGGIKHYLMETNHPIVMIFYLLISPGGFDLNLFSYSLYLIKGIFKHMPNESVSGPQVAIASILAFVCFWVYYKACATEPGKVTS